MCECEHEFLNVSFSWETEVGGNPPFLSPLGFPLFQISMDQKSLQNFMGLLNCLPAFPPSEISYDFLAVSCSFLHKRKTCCVLVCFRNQLSLGFGGFLFGRDTALPLSSAFSCWEQEYSHNLIYKSNIATIIWGTGKTLSAKIPLAGF